MPRVRSARPGHPYLAGGPLLIAHRGGAKLAPENTMAAFSAAVEEWGGDMLEMDVRATRDGEIVVIHDATVDRTCDGTGAVEDLTWTEIGELDAGFHFVDPNGNHSRRGTGVRVPRFEEVLTAFPRTRINVETKVAGSARGLVDIIRRHGAEDRVLVAAEHEPARRPVRDYAGPWGASRQQLLRFWILHRVPLGWLYTPRAEALQVPYTYKGEPVVTPSLLEQAHTRNLAVHVWTVDDPSQMRELLALGVDGIQTDRPDLLARVMTEELGRPRPPGLPDA